MQVNWSLNKGRMRLDDDVFVHFCVFRNALTVQKESSEHTPAHRDIQSNAELVSIIISKNTTNLALSPAQNCTEKSTYADSQNVLNCY